MTALRIRFIAVLCLLAAPLTAGAADVRFEQGSLIIPEQMAYQNNCGTVSSYGLVYRLLQQKVPVYWAVNPSKTSHHRCKNTSDDPRYIDGCDFSVEKDSGNPVSFLANAKGTFSDDFTTFDTSGNPNKTGEGSIKVDKTRKRLRYMGGPFIINSTDAAEAVALIKNHADFASYRGYMPTTCAPGSGFYVRIHRANNAFVAPIARVMNEVPPPIALVQGRNTAGAGSVEILRRYLYNAGLNFTGAEGTFEKHGQIFDVLDQDKDMISSAAYPEGKLNFVPDSKQPKNTYYKVMWSPHWDGDMTTSGQRANLTSTLKNIALFVEKGNSIFNECASIATYENAYFPNDDPKKETGRPLSVYPNDLNVPTQFMTGVEPDPVTRKPNKLQTQTGLQTLNVTELSGTDGFPANSQDCSDPGRSGDCLTFTNYGDLFSQRGDYELSVERSVVEAFRPRANQKYNEGVVQMISTTSTNPARNKWDLYVSRLKNNNSEYGNVIYLAGHSFADQAGGNRVVLNTLLNLAFKPESLEMSRSEPVVDLTYNKNGTINETRVLSGTMLDTPPQALFPERINFRTEKASDWVFPYIEGRLRSYLPSQIASSRQNFDAKKEEWEANKSMPTPGNREIFTVLGSTQTGLKRIPFSLGQLTPGCLDDTTTGKIKAVCDLQEALGWDRDTSGTQLDPGGTGEVDKGLSAATIQAINHTSQHFLQRVRGFCVAHSSTTPSMESMTPNLGQCTNTKFGEVRSVLGGVDHASPAVVGYSKFITTPRAEVAYVGGRDGQLHALYLRGTQAGFSAPAPGTELWAFVPKGQLSRMMNNNARVDISPAVSDVFADYEDLNADGVLSPSERATGNFGWHTVLVSGSGRLGGELFALDVTNPLKPIVLWDVVSSVDNTDSLVATENTVPEWSDAWKDGGSVMPPNYDNLKAPTRLSGPFNYDDLGDSLGVALVPVRRGNRPSYQVVVATNGGKGGAQQLQVFALDAGTGKKLWQWERPYGPDTSNSVPAGVSTLDVDGDGSVDRVYVGDMEGRVWELSAYTGVNLNAFGSGGTAASYPLFSTESALHPVSTAPAIMRLPYTFEKDSVFASLGVGGKAVGKLALVFGTAGVDWVLAKAPDIQGRVYMMAVLPEDLFLRDQLSYDKITAVPVSLRSPMAVRGTVKPGATTYQLLLERERMVGTPKIVGSKMVLSTAYGTTESDPFASDMRGTTRLFDFNTPKPPDDLKPTEVSQAGKTAASVLVLPDGSIVTQSMAGIVRTENIVEVPKAGLPGKRTPVRIGSWQDLGRALAE